MIQDSSATAKSLYCININTDYEKNVMRLPNLSLQGYEPKHKPGICSPNEQPHKTSHTDPKSKLCLMIDSWPPESPKMAVIDTCPYSKGGWLTHGLW